MVGDASGVADRLAEAQGDEHEPHQGDYQRSEFNDKARMHCRHVVTDRAEAVSHFCAPKRDIGLSPTWFA
jgi:hypothetical protein